MSPAKQAIVSIRDFAPDDAESVSALFRAVYGDRYVYPDVYLPSMIHHNNEQQLWQSSVACVDGAIVGHAVLWRHPDTPDCAELALNVVHPSARGMGIATILGRHLCELARKQGLRRVTIKQVSSHRQSQRLAQTLGFHTIGLLLDYVASPFGDSGRESVVLGCLPLQPSPMPALPWPPACRDWVAPMERHFGTQAAIPAAQGLVIVVGSHGQRIEVTLNQPSPDHLSEVARMPTGRLIYVKLALDRRAPAAMQELHRAGFAYAGIMPRAGRGWYGLMQRGYAEQELDLYCPVSRALQQGSMKAELA
ncbi:GNAT family N-acetyltransferase [Rugamonas sp. CCM 8940]|uniref:GNAT family N-acetyltransferase n=1 Tax=Rugamonas sp. CCM 8940 TaxID=2765359 RepID=UPI0018F530AD|nr:GNAT family N-acetyltransferase [Rugamonas sp. CCM 8940]MBJ7312540.1 GNAT family N-acetyltransferase [Rugamonas sp. CCM 8940]